MGEERALGLVLLSCMLLYYSGLKGTAYIHSRPTGCWCSLQGAIVAAVPQGQGGRTVPLCLYGGEYHLENDVAMQVPGGRKEACSFVHSSADIPITLSTVS